jgi:hypothetical protein
MKRVIIFITFFSCFLNISFSQENKVNSEGGLLIGMGHSISINNDFNDYYKSNFNGLFEGGVFYKLNHFKNIVLKSEFNFKTASIPHQFDNSYKGISNQLIMGLNVKCGINKKNLQTNSIDFLFGAGIYTLDQIRVPDPISGLNSIEDGFGAYWGMSLDIEISYIIPIGTKKVGMSSRFCTLPNITFLNKNDVPEFYSFNATMAMFYTF